MLIEQLIDLEKVRSDNLKIRTDLRDGWLVSNIVDDCLQRQIAKKSSNQKLRLVLSTLVTIWLSNIGFHLPLILLQTLVAINSESRLTHCFQAFARSHLK